MKQLNMVLKAAGAWVACLVLGGLSLSDSSASAQPSEGIRPVVAVFEMQVKGVKLSPDTKATLSGYLSSRLTAAGVYRVAPASSIREALVDQKKESHKDCYDQFCQIKIGQAIAANMTLSSLIWRVGNKCSLNLDLYDVRTEAMVNSVEVPGLTCDEVGMKEGIARGAAKLSGQESAEASASAVVPARSAGVAAGERPGKAADAQSVSSEAAGSQTGTLNITGSPEGAMVEIVGPSEYGRGGRGSARLPVKSLRVPAGNYIVRVAAKDFDAAERTVWVYPGAVADLSVELEYGFGQIELTGGPAGVQGQITCSGVDPMNVALPGEGASIKLTVPRGDCRVAFSPRGFESFERFVAVAGGASVPLDVHLGMDRGIDWVQIPGGTFLMGSDKARDEERPVHSVTLSTFEIARTEVTVAQYRKCVDAGVCSAPHWDDGHCVIWDNDNCEVGNLPASFRGDDQPVVCVSWQQAEDYSRWVGGRLPTEAEWEYAARSGGQVRKYPWGGQDATCDRAVLEANAYGCGQNRTWPVCSKPAGNTDDGLCDMIGNAFEWVSDWLGGYSAGPSTNPNGAISGSDKVIRGLSWHSGAGLIPVSVRHSQGPNTKVNVLGFRPARSVR